MTQNRQDVPRLSNPHNVLDKNAGRTSDEFDQHFLLTPPAREPGATDPFEQLELSNANEPSSTLSQLLEQNLRARRQNGAPKRRSASPHGADASSTVDELRLNTDTTGLRRSSSAGSQEPFPEIKARSSTSAGSMPLRIPSVRHRLHSSAGSLSPGSVISSPMIAAMLDITPLPSPIFGPGEWKTLARSRSRASSTSSKHDLGPPLIIPTTSPRKKGYGVLRKSSLSDVIGPNDRSIAVRARSTSEYTSESSSPPSHRNIKAPVEVSVIPVEEPSSLHREHYLGDRRGITPIQAKPVPSGSIFRPPFDELETIAPLPKRTKVEIWTAQSIHTGTTKHYEAIRLLGQGTFSKVYLAVRQMHDRKDSVDYRQDSTDMAGVRARSRRLVAVKVVEPGPAGGADAERIEISLKREVELMKTVLHPSIIHLKAFGSELSGRALLVLNYCPGGDLFDLASKQLSALSPQLVRRIFSELVSAVRYLHQKYIVHRDIKLENVLLNIPVQVFGDVENWQTLDRAVVTLTDLGLSRSIPPPPESPLLETRCGSEDYAAPEIIMGQPYDGRQTDAWALGVLLYCLMEGRLPFDPPPGARGDPVTLRARTPHRIARCEWQWVRYGDEDGEWDAQKGQELEGAMRCVDALLKRNARRKPLAELREWPWIKDGIQVDGGLRWVEEEA